MFRNTRAMTYFLMPLDKRDGGGPHHFSHPLLLPLRTAGLCLALLIGLTWPFPGKELNQIKVEDWKVITTINICLIFFLQVRAK